MIARFLRISIALLRADWNRMEYHVVGGIDYAGQCVVWAGLLCFYHHNLFLDDRQRGCGCVHMSPASHCPLGVTVFGFLIPEVMLMHSAYAVKNGTKEYDTSTRLCNKPLHHHSRSSVSLAGAARRILAPPEDMAKGQTDARERDAKVGAEDEVYRGWKHSTLGW